MPACSKRWWTFLTKYAFENGPNMLVNSGALPWAGCFLKRHSRAVTGHKGELVLARCISAPRLKGSVLEDGRWITAEPSRLNLTWRRAMALDGEVLGFQESHVNSPARRNAEKATQMAVWTLMPLWDERLANDRALVRMSAVSGSLCRFSFSGTQRLALRISWLMRGSSKLEVSSPCSMW